MFIPQVHSQNSVSEMGISSPVQFFLDHALVTPGAGPSVIKACGCCNGGCSCGHQGCSCFYGTEK